MNKFVTEETLHKMGDSLNKFKHHATRALVSGFDILQTGAVSIWSGFSRFIGGKVAVVSQFPNPVEPVSTSVEPVSATVETVCATVEPVSAIVEHVTTTVEHVSTTVDPVPDSLESVPDVIESKDEPSQPTSI
jgi:hypothetical protein